MKRLAPLLLAILVASCQPTGKGDDKLPPVGEAAVEAARLACLKQGGTFSAAGRSQAMTCFTTPRDAGQQCTRSSDCESACLARSQTCAPLKPLFGCQDILGANGERLTQCVD